METEATGQIVKVFYCYAREDKDLRDELDAHLTPLRRAGRIRTWSDRQIAPGTNWQEAIDNNLETADLILILVSARFMASDYCWGKEMKRALEQHKAGKSQVIPIILRPVMWKETPLGELQALPQDGKPVIQWPHLDAAFENVAQGVSEVVTTLLAILEQEAIHLQKLQELVAKRDKEYGHLTRLNNYQGDLAYTLQFKRQSEAQLLEQLAAVRKEIAQIESFAKTAASNITTSQATYEKIDHEYAELYYGYVFMADGLPPIPWRGPRLLDPPFKAHDEQK